MAEWYSPMRAPLLSQRQARGQAFASDWEGPHDDRLADQQRARALGWFSIGLGLVQMAASRGFNRAIGLRGEKSDAGVTRLVGLRELVTGAGILATGRPGPWLWGRVAGDALDLALLGSSLADERTDRGRVAAAATAVAGVMALDVYAASRLSVPGGSLTEQGGFEVRKAITINRPAEDLYRFWRDFRNLPRVMSHLSAVEVIDQRRSRWTTKAPAGQSITWEAELVEDRVHAEIAWRSLPGSAVANAGSVRFLPAAGGRGTELHVELRYDPPGGVLGALVARLFSEAPEQQLQDDLRLFKQVMETGEVVRSEGSGDGARLRQRPAQPLAHRNGH